MNPNILIIYPTPKRRHRARLLSDHEIYCSPHDTDQLDTAQSPTLKTPMGPFDIGDLIARLPLGWQPDLLVVKADATRQILPRRLDRLKCPKVLISGDTHHLLNPISFLIDYARSESFDFVITDHDRQHLHFYRRAGFEKIYWIPALNYALTPRPIQASSEKEAIFVGQLGRHHPYRRELFQGLIDRGAPIIARLAPHDQTPDLYSRYPISLNCSLNGDLNLRVFEILGSGGFLLTDRLSPEAGLSRLFEEGKHFEGYSGQDELREKITHYLSCPATSLDLRQRGFAAIERSHTPEHKAQQLLDYVFSNIEAPELSMETESWNRLISLPPASLPSHLAAYQSIQDLHLKSNRLTLFTSDAQVPAWLSDLPRIAAQAHATIQEDRPTLLPRERRLLIIDESTSDAQGLVDLFERHTGEYIVNASPKLNDLALSGLLENFGYKPSRTYPCLYRVSQPSTVAQRWLSRQAVNETQSLLECQQHLSYPISEYIGLAQVSQELGRLDLSGNYLELAIGKDRCLQDAYIALASLQLAAENQAEAFILLNEARRLGPLPDDIEPFHHELANLQTEEKSPSALDYLEIASDRPCYFRLLPTTDSLRPIYFEHPMSRKQTLLFLDTLKELQSSGVPCEAIIVEDTLQAADSGQLPSELETRQLTRSVSVMATPAESDLRSALARSNLALFANTSSRIQKERLLQAQLAGLAAVVPQQENDSASIEHRKNGLRANLSSPFDLGRSLYELSQDRSLWDELCRHGQAAALINDRKKAQ